MAKTAMKPKRARKKVESTFADKWEPENKGDELEGTYLGFETAKGTRSETFTVYQIMAEDGKRWSIAGAYLDSIMKQIPKNTYVYVTYKGEQDVRNGSMKLFDVEVAEDVETIDPFGGDDGDDEDDKA